MKRSIHIAADACGCGQRYKTVTVRKKIHSFRDITLQWPDTSLPLHGLNFSNMAATKRTLPWQSSAIAGQQSRRSRSHLDPVSSPVGSTRHRYMFAAAVAAAAACGLGACAVGPDYQPASGRDTGRVACAAADRRACRVAGCAVARGLVDDPQRSGAERADRAGARGEQDGAAGVCASRQARARRGITSAGFLADDRRFGRCESHQLGVTLRERRPSTGPGQRRESTAPGWIRLGAGSFRRPAPRAGSCRRRSSARAKRICATCS